MRIVTVTATRLAACAALLLALCLAPPAPQAAGWQPHPELLVTPRWLAAHAGQPALRIVDVRDADAYAAGHIPGAVNLPAGHLFAEVDGVDGMLPPVAEVAAELGRAAIGPQSVVVAYDASGGLYAARLFWVLDYLGQGGGRVLDGGWPRWRREGHPAAHEPTVLPAVTFTPRPQPDDLASLDWVRAHLHDPAVVLVDARSTLEYTGATTYSEHRGHIPGAVSMEWKRHLRSDGSMRPAAELRAEYEALGVTPDREAVVYCQVLVRAAHSYFTLRWLGLPRVRGYDGSWAEWGNRADTPKELF